ncbi:MAG: DUF5696 domain-containing protein [Oscillospiraceae bacterium]|nr:DUF5696 domain-containing protein [Oscillospiraceae bacterium]
MKLGTKLFLSLLGAALIITLAYQGYLLFHFRLHSDYKALLTAGGEFEAGTPFAGVPDAGAPGGMVLAAQNGILKLYVNPLTAEAAVYDARTGVMTYTNPPGAENDPVAGDVNKSILKSQLLVEFYNSNRMPGRYNSYDYSVSLGQFSLESLSGGFRCVYTLGDISAPTGIVPVYITPERLEVFTEKMSDGGRYVLARYVESSNARGFLELMETARTGPATLRRMNTLFEEAGYTDEDYSADMAESNVEGAAPISFTVPLEYILDGDSLVVRLQSSRIVERGGGRIDRIQLLRSFGAGGADEEGYLVVPNGSGSIIRFNNGKTYAEDYTQFVYDLDPLLSEYTKLGNSEMARLPYFGIQREGQGMLAEIQTGDTAALLTASISGKLNSYNYVFPTFVLRGTNTLSMFGSTGNEADIPIVESGIADIDITVRYSFLTNEYDGYSGMARYARERLIERGVLTPKKEAGDIPFYMDLIGSAGGQRFFLSVSYLGQYTMTTYEQAARIADTLAAAGISNQVINYQGWFNRGYYHDVPDKIKPLRRLGSKRELEELASEVEARGGRLYADVAFQRVTFLSKRFIYSLETSRYYGGGFVAAFGQVDPTTLRNTAALGYIETLYDLLSPKFLGRYTDKFIKAFDGYDVTGISLRDLGSDLHSDRKRTEVIQREDAKTIVLDSIGKLAGTGNRLMFSGGNAYVFGYSDDLINVPISHNAIYIADDEIPFYQMLINGCIDYAGPAINLSDAYDENELTLRLVEFGAAPHFTFTAESSSDLKYTGLNRLYGATFDNWSQTAVGIYSKVNGALSAVSGSSITNHEILENGLRRVSYDNGTVILINRTGGGIETDGGFVGAKSFLVLNG